MLIYLVLAPILRVVLTAEAIITILSEQLENLKRKFKKIRSKFFRSYETELQMRVLIFLLMIPTGKLRRVEAVSHRNPLFS